MESSRKLRRGGGLKGKLQAMSFYRAPKPSSTTQYSRELKSTPSSTGSVDFLVDDVDYAVPVMKDFGGYGKEAAKGGDLGGGDDSVDKRAARYISCVLERFRLEQLEQDKRKCY